MPDWLSDILLDIIDELLWKNDWVGLQSWFRALPDPTLENWRFGYMLLCCTSPAKNKIEGRESYLEKLRLFFNVHKDLSEGDIEGMTKGL